MNIILLSGGSGTRLWPLSNDIRSKQFIKIFKGADGRTESMVQRVYRQIKRADKASRITIATAKTQVSAIRNHLGDDVDISVEPDRRDTFPAIALAVLKLHEEQGVGKEEAVCVLPVDPYVEDSYFETVRRMYEIAKETPSGLVVMGITPTYPSEKYGYVMPKDDSAVTKVRTFHEKPDVKTAEKYLSEGGLWNGGVFAFRMGYLLKIIKRELSLSHYEEMFRNYGKLKKISFDYAVAEKEKNITLVRYNGEWKDVGSWLTLTETMAGDSIGKAVRDNTCVNTSVINELNVPMLCMGLKDVVVCASPDGILVSDKDASSYMKPYVEKMEKRVMFAEKSWGSFTIIDVTEASLTIRVNLNKGHRMHYHMHEHRDEIWNVVAGHGRAVIDGEMINVSPGDTLRMNALSKHTIYADTQLTLIEVQIGKDISVEDKVTFRSPRFK